MRQQRVLRHGVFERGAERVDVVESLTAEAALAEQVLVGVRYRGRVRVHPGVARIEPREQRAGGAGEGDADPRLQDPIALSDTSDGWVVRRPVQGMADDADEDARRVTRQPGVAVERDAIPDLRQNRPVADRQDETGIGRAAEEPVELLDLAALALPSHPEALAFVPLAQAMEQEEAIRIAVTVLRVEGGDAVGRGSENLRVAREHGVRG